MNITEMIIKGLNGGQLQRLAREIIIRKENDWRNVNIVGGVEGTSKTRSGIPDIQAEHINGGKIFIEVTTENRKSKVLSDIEACINKLNGEANATIVSFLSFDPTEDTIDLCKKKCNEVNIQYKFYNNSMIKEILDNEFPELKILYLERVENSEFLHIDLFNDDYSKRLKYIVKNTNWIESNDYEDVYALMFEIIDNAIIHGLANNIKLQVSDSAIRILDDGKPFNLEMYVCKDRVGGGKYTLDYFNCKFSGKLFYQYQHIMGKNCNVISKTKIDEIHLCTDSNCKIDVPFFPYGRSQMFSKTFLVEIDETCDPVILNMEENFPPISICREIIDELILKIPTNKEIVLLVPNDREKMISGFLEINGLIGRVNVETCK